MLNIKKNNFGGLDTLGRFFAISAKRDLPL